MDKKRKRPPECRVCTGCGGCDERVGKKEPTPEDFYYGGYGQETPEVTGKRKTPNAGRRRPK